METKRPRKKLSQLISELEKWFKLTTIHMSITQNYIIQCTLYIAHLASLVGRAVDCSQGPKFNPNTLNNICHL